MTDQSNPAPRRIMDELGDERRIPILNVSEGDVSVIIACSLLALGVGVVLGATGLLFPLLVMGFFAGALVVYAAPNHLSAWTWIGDIARYSFVRPRITLNASEDEGAPSTRGGLRAYTPFSLDERTQDLTNVERAWPGASAVERTDGRFEGYFEVTPANMDFAMSGDWAAVQRTAEAFANNELDFSITMYVTTQAFPVEHVVSRLDDRLDDADVRSNPTFDRLIREYRETRPEDLAETRELRYYLGTSVSRLSVYNRYERERTPSETLAAIPYVGVVFTPFVTRRERFDEAELRAAMIRKLDERLAVVETEFVEKLPGWTARRLTTTELFCLALTFWNGEPYDETHAEHLLRTAPETDNVTRTEADA